MIHQVRTITDCSVNYVDGIYNEIVFINKEAVRSIRKSLKNYSLVISNHAKEQFTRNATLKYLGKGITEHDLRLHNIRINNRIVEYYTKNNNIYKYLLRTSASDKKDICVVISPKENVNLIVTAWIIDKEDNHCTADKSKYITRKQHMNVNSKCGVIMNK